MRNKLLLGVVFGAAFSFYAQISSAQGMAVNTTGSPADASAMLDVSSTAKGMLVPRMTNSNRGSISSPATGLLIYQTDATPGFYYNSGTPGSPVWTAIAGGAGGGSGTEYVASFTTPVSTTPPFYSGFLQAGTNTVAPDLIQNLILKPTTIDAMALWCNVTSAPGTADVITVTLMKNGSPTTLTATVTCSTVLNTPVYTTSFSGGPVTATTGDMLYYSMTHTNGTPAVLVKVYSHAQ